MYYVSIIFGLVIVACMFHINFSLLIVAFKQKSWWLTACFLWSVAMTIVLAAVVIDQMVILPWLELTDYHVCKE